MASIIAINDNGALCCNARFKECRVSFKDKSINYNHEIHGRLKTSQLIKPLYVKVKNEILCICHGFTPRQKKNSIVNQKRNDEENYELSDIELEREFPGLNILKVQDEKEAIEEYYQKEKKKWVQSGMNSNSRLRNAVALNYDCDEEYCKERMMRERPEFFMVNHKTFFWQSKYPSEHAIEIEKKINRELIHDKERYKTYTRIILLESVDDIQYNNKECILIYNYLSKFEIIAPISVASVTRK